MLLLLESKTVKLPAPKNIYSEDIVVSNDVLMFATSKTSIKHRGEPYNASDGRETEMVAARWENYEFHNQISPQKQDFSQFFLIKSM